MDGGIVSELLAATGHCVDESGPVRPFHLANRSGHRGLVGGKHRLNLVTFAGGDNCHRHIGR